jgi:predicted alpha/beta hydrolase
MAPAVQDNTLGGAGVSPVILVGPAISRWGGHLARHSRGLGNRIAGGDARDTRNLCPVPCSGCT